MDRIAHRRTRASKQSATRRGLRILLLLSALLPFGSVLGAVPKIDFSAASIEFEDMRFEGVRATLAEDGAFELAFDRAAGSAERYLGGGLSVTGVLGALARSPDALDVSCTLNVRGVSAALSLQDHAGTRVLELTARKQSLLQLAGWPGLPAETAWLRNGLFDSLLTLRQEQAGAVAANLRLDIQSLGFDSPEGRYAGEALQLAVKGSWPDIAAGEATVLGTVSNGEILIDDFYRDFSEAALDFDTNLHWDDEVLDFSRLHIADDDALDLQAALRLDMDTAEPDWSLEVSRLALDFPAAYKRYVEPLAAAWTLNGLEVTGRLVWSGEWASGNLVAGDLEVSDLSVVDIRRQRFAVTGLQARLKPGDPEFDSRVAWRGLLFGRINLGAGEAALDSEPGVFALREPLFLGVLGGQLQLNTLKITLPGSRADGAGEPDVLLRARIDELDMSRLTAALGWPSFTGTVSGDIPGVSLDDGVLAVDGEIRIDVFDGRIALKNLSLERAFGVLPGLAADMSLVNLDLEQLTQTFSFGRIAGRLDGYVNDLRMLDWKPVAFDAWLGTPQGQGGSNDISRQAVNRLTTLGGGSATTALTSPLMRMFSSFSYRRLGLGCILQNNICQLRGLSEDQSSVLLLEGSGVPKITIRAYNRNIDWPQMVSNLLAISADSEVQISQ